MSCGEERKGLVAGPELEEPIVNVRNRMGCVVVAMVVALTCARAVAAAGPFSATSPDGRLSVALVADGVGGFAWSLSARGQALLANAALGLDFGAAGRMPGTGWRAAKTASRSVNDVWKPVWGKRAVVPDRYNETTVDLEGAGAPFGTLRIVLRAYDDGVAFRYEAPAAAPGVAVRAAGELTTFAFAGDFTAWFYNGENHNLGPDRLSAIDGKRLPVMTLKAGDRAYLAVHEADLRAGDPMAFVKKGPMTFGVAGSPGEVGPGFASPWRAIFFGETPGVMVDSHLIELLNPPPEGDFSWVKPGVAVWDWRINGARVPGFAYSMSLPSWLRMVDFAAESGIRHLVLDADWYGPEFEHTSDPTQGDKAADVRKLIAYGKGKGVGIWLYLNDVGGRKYPIGDTLKQYGEWGAAGVKYGFMKGTPAEKNARTRMITELCAKNRLLVDYHDGPVHPYGQMRTWPNAVTREFCHAQLDAKRVFVPKTFVTTVFVNMLAGPLDMNNGMFDLRQGKTDRVDNAQEAPSTLAAEAARTLIVFSGATIIPDVPEYYRKYPDLLAFIAAQQMPWRESRTLSGAIGEHIVMARQAANGAWLVGAATDETARELDLPCSFLGAGAWKARIVEDGADAHYLTKRESLKALDRAVTAADTIRVRLAPGGGACVLLRPE
jgi:alpha-glucosidase